MHIALYKECTSNQRRDVCIKFLEEGFFRGAGKCVTDKKKNIKTLYTIKITPKQ